MVPRAGAADAEGAFQVNRVSDGKWQQLLFVCCVTLALVAAVIPEVTYRWYYYLPDLTRASQIVGPTVFVPATIAAYYYSGRRRLTLLLWLLAPLCFLRIVLFIATGILWSLRGGIV